MTKGQPLSERDKEAEEKRNKDSLRTLEETDIVQRFCEPDTDEFLFNIQVWTFG